MSTLATTIGRGVTGSRPAASEAGRLYYDTTTNILYRDNGSSWDSVSPSALTNPMSAVGDLIVGDTAGTPAALAAVATGKLLVSQGVTTKPAYGYNPFHGCTVTASGAANMTNGSYIAVPFDTESYDTDAMHFTSAAALTGTVAKSGTTALVGTGTLFTTELAVGQVISVPGTSTEVRVVTVITDNLHLTVSSAFANTASGQTATRVNSAIVNPFSGTTYFSIKASMGVTFSPGDGSYIAIAINGTNKRIAVVPNSAVEAEGAIAADFALSQWDYAEIYIRVAANSKQVLQGASTPFFSMHMIGQ